MSAWAVYNEIEPYAAQWLRNQIAAGLIAPGVVDERSIEDVCPDDYREFAQVHLFAGLGIWSHALRGVGWPDDWPIWSSSYPCQPFSAAGKGLGVADERHLWPAGFHLKTQLRPERIVGEQVASPDGLAWFDAVSTDLEGADYAPRALDTCVAGFGGPNLRQRLYWDAVDLHARPGFIGGVGPVANAHGANSGPEREQRSGQFRQLEANGGARGLADDGRAGRPDGTGRSRGAGEPAGWVEGAGALAGRGVADRMESPSGAGSQGRPFDSEGEGSLSSIRCEPSRVADASRPGQRARAGEPRPGGYDADPGYAGAPSAPRLVADASSRGRRELGDASQSWSGGHFDGGFEPDRPGPVNGFWAAADWLHCRDAKWRPVEGGTFPLAHGDPSRSGRLRAYGNAINLEQAKGFLRVALAPD